MLARINGTGLVIEVELLCDVAARHRVPLAPDKGERQIEALARPLYRRLTKINIGRSVIGALGGLAAIVGFAVIVNDPSQPGIWIAQSMAVGGASAAMMSWYAGRLIQRRRRFFADRPYDIPLTPEIEQLLADLASGRMRAMMSTGYGPISASALRATDGQLFDIVLAPETFANRFAPILLLRDHKTFSALWMPWGRALDRPIYVEKTPAEEPQVEQEPPSGPQVETHWIAKIPAERFADWKSHVQQRGPWDGYAQIEVGQVLDGARRKAESDALAGKRFSVNGFAKRARTPRLAAETIRKLIAWSGDHDYDWVRKSAETASIGNDQVR